MLIIVGLLAIISLIAFIGFFILLVLGLIMKILAFAGKTTFKIVGWGLKTGLLAIVFVVGTVLMSLLMILL